MSANITTDDEDTPSYKICQVCGSMIDITEKKNQHVVKCEVCKEATVSIAYYSNHLSKSREVLITSETVRSSMFINRPSKMPHQARNILGALVIAC